MTVDRVFAGFNPYFTGLPILIRFLMELDRQLQACFNPYFTGLPILIINPYNVADKVNGVSILILLDYLFL